MNLVFKSCVSLHEMRTWVYEIVVMAIILCLVNFIAANNWINWITTIAILLTFNHGQIGDRLQERQKNMSKPTVECYHKLNKLFAGKEVVWIIAFILMENYAAIVGSVLFFIYPFWRKYYRKKIKPLYVLSDHEMILNYISVIRNSFIGSEEVYCYGSCYQFYKILKYQFPSANAYYDMNHIITEIGGKYYDITGEVNGASHTPFESYPNSTVYKNYYELKK